MAMVAVLGMTAALSAEAAPVAAAAAVAAPVAAAAATVAPAPAQAPMTPAQAEFAKKLDAAHKATFEAMSKDARETAMMMQQKGCQGKDGCKAKDCNVACDMAAKKMADQRAAK